MKANSLFKRCLPLVFLFATLLVCACKTIPKEQGITASTIMRLSSAARSSLDRTNWNTLKVGDLVDTGTYLQTSDVADMIVSLGEKAIPIHYLISNGSVYDPAVHPANLLLLAPNSAVKLKKISAIQSANRERNEISLVLSFGTIQGYVKKQSSTYEIQFTNGVVIMRPGIYRMDSMGNISLFEGSCEVRLPARNITNALTAGQRFDIATATISNFDISLLGNWRHDIWLPSDPAYVPWANVLETWEQHRNRNALAPEPIPQRPF